MAISKDSPKHNVKLVDGNGPVDFMSGTFTALHATVSVTGSTVLVGGTALQAIKVVGFNTSAGGDVPFGLESRTVGTTATPVTLTGVYDSIDGVPMTLPVTPNVNTAWYTSAVGSDLMVNQTAAAARVYDVIYTKE